MFFGLRRQRSPWPNGRKHINWTHQTQKLQTTNLPPEKASFHLLTCCYNLLRFFFSFRSRTCFKGNPGKTKRTEISYIAAGKLSDILNGLLTPRRCGLVICRARPLRGSRSKRCLATMSKGCFFFFRYRWLEHLRHPSCGTL